MAVSELETDRGDADLALILRPDMRRFQALDLLLELKYLGLKELDSSGEQVRAQSRESLAALPAVAARLEEAAAQATDYGATLRALWSEGPARLCRGGARGGAVGVAGAVSIDGIAGFYCSKGAGVSRPRVAAMR
jgi:hypothetical protein